MQLFDSILDRHHPLTISTHGTPLFVDRLLARPPLGTLRTGVPGRLGTAVRLLHHLQGTTDATEPPKQTVGEPLPPYTVPVRSLLENQPTEPAAPLAVDSPRAAALGVAASETVDAGRETASAADAPQRPVAGVRMDHPSPAGGVDSLADEGSSPLDRRPPVQHHESAPTNPGQSRLPKPVGASTTGERILLGLAEPAPQPMSTRRPSRSHFAADSRPSQHPLTRVQVPTDSSGPIPPAPTSDQHPAQPSSSAPQETLAVGRPRRMDKAAATLLSLTGSRPSSVDTDRPTASTAEVPPQSAAGMRTGHRSAFGDVDSLPAEGSPPLDRRPPIQQPETTPAAQLSSWPTKPVQALAGSESGTQTPIQPTNTTSTVGSVLAETQVPTGRSAAPPLSGSPQPMSTRRPSRSHVTADSRPSQYPLARLQGPMSGPLLPTPSSRLHPPPPTRGQHPTHPSSSPSLPETPAVSQPRRMGETGATLSYLATARLPPSAVDTHPQPASLPVTEASLPVTGYQASQSVVSSVSTSPVVSQRLATSTMAPLPVSRSGSLPTPTPSPGVDEQSAKSDPPESASSPTEQIKQTPILPGRQSARQHADSPTIASVGDSTGASRADVPPQPAPSTSLHSLSIPKRDTRRSPTQVSPSGVSPVFAANRIRAPTVDRPAGGRHDRPSPSRSSRQSRSVGTDQSAASPVPHPPVATTDSVERSPAIDAEPAGGGTSSATGRSRSAQSLPQPLQPEPLAVLPAVRSTLANLRPPRVPLGASQPAAHSAIATPHSQPPVRPSTLSWLQTASSGPPTASQTMVRETTSAADVSTAPTDKSRGAGPASRPVSAPNRPTSQSNRSVRSPSGYRDTSTGSDGRVPPPLPAESDRPTASVTEAVRSVAHALRSGRQSTSPVVPTQLASAAIALPAARTTGSAVPSRLSEPLVQQSVPDRQHSAIKPTHVGQEQYSPVLPGQFVPLQQSTSADRSTPTDQLTPTDQPVAPTGQLTPTDLLSPSTPSVDSGVQAASTTQSSHVSHSASTDRADSSPRLTSTGPRPTSVGPHSIPDFGSVLSRPMGQPVVSRPPESPGSTIPLRSTRTLPTRLVDVTSPRPPTVSVLPPGINTGSPAPVGLTEPTAMREAQSATVDPTQPVATRLTTDRSPVVDPLSSAPTPTTASRVTDAQMDPDQPRPVGHRSREQSTPLPTGSAATDKTNPAPLRSPPEPGPTPLRSPTSPTATPAIPRQASQHSSTPPVPSVSGSTSSPASDTQPTTSKRTAPARLIQPHEIALLRPSATPLGSTVTQRPLGAFRPTPDTTVSSRPSRPGRRTGDTGRSQPTAADTAASQPAPTAPGQQSPNRTTEAESTVDPLSDVSPLVHQQSLASSETDTPLAGGEDGLSVDQLAEAFTPSRPASTPNTARIDASPQDQPQTGPAGLRWRSESTQSLSHPRSRYEPQQPTKPRDELEHPRARGNTSGADSPQDPDSSRPSSPFSSAESTVGQPQPTSRPSTEAQRRTSAPDASRLAETLQSGTRTDELVGQLYREMERKRRIERQRRGL